MNMIVQSWKANRCTFGGGATVWTSKKITEFYSVLVAASGILAFLSGPLKQELFESVLTAISIFAGFTFAILIFFVDHKFEVVEDHISLKQQALQEKLDSLTKMSFHIIFYFGLLTIAIVACCIANFLAVAFSARLPLQFHDALYFTDTLGRTVFFGLLIEAGITFYRMMRRLRYLFEKVRGSI